MGCFCRNRLPLPTIPGEQDQDDDPAPEHPVLEAVDGWLAARWLPAPAWRPEPDWQGYEWPDPPMTPAASAVLLGLVTAQDACRTVLRVDPAEPVEVVRLARIVRTLNRRTEQLRALDEDRRPWEALARLNGQVDSVRRAAAARVFEAPPQEGPLAPWRTLVSGVKALAPLVAVVQAQKLDLADPSAVDVLAATVRRLRRVVLPDLEDPPLLLRMIARIDAVARLRASLGTDPRPHPFARVRAAVERRAAEAVALLPESVRMEAGALLGMPLRQPNPSLLVNAETIRVARTLTPEVLERLRWQVPDRQDLPLLTVGATVAALVQAMASLGEDPVQQRPCDAGCDAAAAGV